MNPEIERIKQTPAYDEALSALSELRKYFRNKQNVHLEFIEEAI